MLVDSWSARGESAGSIEPAAVERIYSLQVLRLLCLSGHNAAIGGLLLRDDVVCLADDNADDNGGD